MSDDNDIMVRRYIDTPPRETVFHFEKETVTKCLICDVTYVMMKEMKEYLAHLYKEHRMIIADVYRMALVDEYLDYWKDFFTADNIADYCTTMLMNCLPDGTPSKDEKYYLLSDALPQDADIRNKLTKKELDICLKRLEFERSDKTYRRQCVFCRKCKIEPTRAAYINHLFYYHSLNLGRVENLVFVDHLIDTVDRLMQNFTCLYCRKVFPDRVVLKEHLRKKTHRSIDPFNYEYDKYFLANYTRVTVPYKTYPEYVKLEGEPTNWDDIDEDWSDWEDHSQNVVCLFCKEKDPDLAVIKEHMKEKHHGFDLDEVFDGKGFYKRIKIINYIRRLVMKFTCIFCEKKHKNMDQLVTHMDFKKHYILGDESLWGLTKNFFPTYQDDVLLYSIEDDICSPSSDAKWVKPEDDTPKNPYVEAIAKGEESEYITDDEDYVDDADYRDDVNSY